jgi:glycosyltransferase involved in cell wall biosynthesis
MYHQKGFDVLLDAYQRVTIDDSDVQLILVGDGPERAALQAQAIALGVTDRVTFTGWIPPADVASVIDSATVVVVPSREEGFGLSALEAAMRGRPVVAARVGGLPEVIGDEDGGLLVEPESPYEMAEAILALLGDPGRAATLGASGRERAVRLFSADQHVSAHEALYRQLADGRV